MKEKFEQLKEFVMAHKKQLIIGGLVLVAGTVAFIAIRKAKQNKRR